MNNRNDRKITPKTYKGPWIICLACNSFIKTGMIKPIKLDENVYHFQCLPKKISAWKLTSKSSP